MDLMKLVTEFDTEDKCRAFLEGLRWPDGIECPRCSGKRCYSDAAQWECASCDYTFSVTSGTMLHDTHLPLRKWLVATYLMVEAKKGISALQLKRTMGVAYKTAWYLSHRLRAAMRDAYPFPLKGIVEVDETYVGGKVRGMGRGYKGNKAIVVGAVQRGGKIVLQVAQDNRRKTLHGFIRANTDPETEAIYTDEWPAYKGIGDADTRHEAVNHRAEEWVRGDVHTNTVEGVWSLFKRSLIGSFHRVSVKHLDAYLDELEWRFNNRDNPYLFRDTLIRLLNADNLEYKVLTTS
jgi:transposase-like protein